MTLCLASAAPAAAGDWPQILGPHRNGVAENEKLAASWPAGGPKLVWKRPIGLGLAGVAVVGPRAYLFHRLGDQEWVEALDVTDGKSIWKRGFPTAYAGGFIADNGPRCVPVVQDGRVFALGAAGKLHCLKADDGAPLWSRDLAQDFRAPDGYFGAGASPLIVDDRVLVNIGGRNGAGIVALAVGDGKTLWQATDALASYSSPVLAPKLAGKRQAVFVTRFHTMGVDPDDGTVYWQLPFGQRGPTVNGANPVILGEHVFLTASYGIGAVFARITDADQPEVKWESDNILSSQYATPVVLGEHLYGIDGREDMPGARLRCIHPGACKVAWTEENFGKASLLLADGKLLALKTNGDLVMAQADPRGYRQLGSAKVLDNKTFALPALSEGRLYVHDSRELKCLDLR